MTNNNYHHIIRRPGQEEWELSIISTPHSYGGEQGLFEIGLCHNHDRYDLNRHVEVIEHHQNFEEVGVTISWFLNSTVEEIQTRFNSYFERFQE